MHKLEQKIALIDKYVPDIKVPEYTNWRIFNFRRLKERKRKQTKHRECERTKLVQRTFYGLKENFEKRIKIIMNTFVTSSINVIFIVCFGNQ